MDKEATRRFLEDWFIDHPDDVDAFSGEALERLSAIVEAAVAMYREGGAGEEDGNGVLPPAAAAGEDRRVMPLLLRFLSVAERLMREKEEEYFAKTGKHLALPPFRANAVTEAQMKSMKEIVKVVLELEKRAENLRKALRETRVTGVAVAESLGVNRSSLTFVRSPLLSCLVDFMQEHAEEVEGRAAAPKTDAALLAEIAELREALAEEKRRAMARDGIEVQLRNMQERYDRQQRDLEAHRRSAQHNADKCLKLKELLEKYGIDVPMELDEEERMEAQAAAYRALQAGGGTVS